MKKMLVVAMSSAAAMASAYMLAGGSTPAVHA